MTLASHLTERDRQIALDCFEHRVLTTGQIKRLHFTDTRTAVARLDALYRLRVLDRFRPSLPRGRGTAPYHWILDEAGALIVATHKDVERATLGWQHAVAAGVATSPKLAHHVDVNEFIVRLAVDARRAGGWLSEWYGERTLHDFLDGEVIPDSYAVLSLPDRPPLHLFVELDRGTETLGRLQEKAQRYRKALRWQDVRKLDPLVLLLVPSAGRFRSVSAALAGSDAPFAVVVWGKHSTGSVLEAVLDAEAARAWECQREREDAEIRREAQAQAAVGTPVEGLRSGMASDLLDHPQQPEQEATL